MGRAAEKAEEKVSADGNKWKRLGNLMLVALLSAALSWWYVTVTAAHVFRGWGDWLILLALMALTFVGIFFKLGPKLVANQRLHSKQMIRWTIALVAFLLLILVGLSWWLGALSFGLDDDVRQNLGIKNAVEVITLLIVAIGAAFALFATKWGTEQYFARSATEMKLRRIEKKLSAIQQSWVQQDLPPHLLFNSLSVARALTRKDPTKARKAMTLIGELTRYYVKKCKVPEIPLREELKQLALLKELYALRFDADLALVIQLPDDVAGLKIIPMLLVLLLENMAKHGILTDPRRPARLTITHKGGRTEITAQNYVVPRSESGTDGLKIAIKSIRKQLNLRYPGQSGIDVSLVDDVFTAFIFFV